MMFIKISVEQESVTICDKYSVVLHLVEEQ